MVEGTEQHQNGALWPINSEYVVENGALLARGEFVKEYDPLDHQVLAIEFAKLQGEDGQGLIKFALTWGLPGAGWLGLPPDGRDLLPWIWGHAGNARLVLELQHYVQNEDRDGLSLYLDAHWSGVTTLGGRQIRTIAFPRGFNSMEDAFDARDPLVAAQEIIASVISNNMSDLRYEVTAAPLQLRPEPTCPLVATYWHLATIVTAGRSLRRCADCHKLFVVRDRRQRYCPPPPFQRGKTGSLCGERARKRKMRNERR